MRASHGPLYGTPDSVCGRAHDHFLQMCEQGVWLPVERKLDETLNSFTVRAVCARWLFSNYTKFLCNLRRRLRLSINVNGGEPLIPLLQRTFH